MIITRNKIESMFLNKRLMQLARIGILGSLSTIPSLAYGVRKLIPINQAITMRRTTLRMDLTVAILVLGVKYGLGFAFCNLCVFVVEQ
jgi:fluoride ion exporter CrcB/FEX